MQGGGGERSGGAQRPLVFISHIAAEAPVAHVLKDWIEATFPDRCAVFVSSDIRDIPAGSRWLQEVDQALAATRVLLVVCSPISLTRPWINFETGCAWSKGVPVLPLCHSGQPRDQLPPPISTFQALEIESPGFVGDFFTSLAGHLGISAVPRIDQSTMRAHLDQACAAARQGAPTPEPASVPPQVEDGALHVLKMIVAHDDPSFSADELAEVCGLPKPKAQYYIDRLYEQKLLVRQLFMGAPAQYHLSSKGRKYLVDIGAL